MASSKASDASACLAMGIAMDLLSITDYLSRLIYIYDIIMYVLYIHIMCSIQKVHLWSFMCVVHIYIYIYTYLALYTLNIMSVCLYIYIYHSFEAIKVGSDHTQLESFLWGGWFLSHLCSFFHQGLLLGIWSQEFNDDHDWLVGGAISILKNDEVRQWGWDDIPYMKWKITFMFETTNQLVGGLLMINRDS